MLITTYLLALLMNKLIPKGPSGIGPDVYLFVGMCLLFAVQIFFLIWHFLSKKFVALQPYRLKLIKGLIKLVVGPALLFLWGIFLYMELQF